MIYATTCRIGSDMERRPATATAAAAAQRAAQKETAAWWCSPRVGGLTAGGEGEPAALANAREQRQRQREGKGRQGQARQGGKRRGRTLTEARQRHLRLDPSAVILFSSRWQPVLGQRMITHRDSSAPPSLPRPQPRRACISSAPSIGPAQCRRNAPTTPTRRLRRSRTNCRRSRDPTRGASVATAARASSTAAA